MGQAWEYLKIAFMNIRNNKGRSVLTMLGIIIGIAAVIMVIAVGQGVRNEINGELDTLGGGQIELSVNEQAEGAPITFTSEDYDYLEDRLDHIKGVTGSTTAFGTASGNKGNFTAIVYGGYPALEYTNKEDIIKGHYFTKEDVENGNLVCVIRASGAMALFGTTDVVGLSFETTLSGVSQDIRIVGVREDNASQLMTMFDGDSTTIEFDMPITTMESAFAYNVLEDSTSLTIIAESSAYENEVAQRALTLLSARKQTQGTNRIQVMSFTDVTSQFDSILGTITLFISFVAAISLLVGGIGVMNIMLVSVTERTREIGIRKSLGARTGSIMLQFLAEAAAITLLGGIIGIIIGSIGGNVICNFLGYGNATVSSTIIIGATLFSSAVGIFFGIYPARKAAKLSPIEALRHE